MNSLALISLIVLVAVILIGFFRKVNVGLVAILAVTIFGTCIGQSDSKPSAASVQVSSSCCWVSPSCVPSASPTDPWN